MKKNICVIFCAGLLALSACARKQASNGSAPGPESAAATVAGSSADPAQPAASPAPAEPAPPPPITLPAGSSVRVRLNRTLDTRTDRLGERFTATLDEPLVSGDRVAVPKGTEFDGHIVGLRHAGRFKGRAMLSLQLDSFTLNGETYDVMSNDATRVSRGHKKRNWLWIGGGSGGGAAIGALAGGGAGALIGAGAGAGAGVVGAAITGEKHVTLPAETPVRFTLRSSVEVAEH